MHKPRVGEFDPSAFLMTLVTFASYWLKRKYRAVAVGNNHQQLGKIPLEPR
jgi:hypothetical protein